jgi:hypothetical protein
MGEARIPGLQGEAGAGSTAKQFTKVRNEYGS